jgi:hypothetical protein
VVAQRNTGVFGHVETLRHITKKYHNVVFLARLHVTKQPVDFPSGRTTCQKRSLLPAADFETAFRDA